jgi:hypothetical protein
MAQPVLATVRTGPERRPSCARSPMQEISNDNALLEVEVAGICDTSADRPGRLWGGFSLMIIG